jgi:hypothetical protein
MSAFGSGPSNGQFWYGSIINFPGFLYKKNVGVGGRRSTKMTPGGNITCNNSTYLYNKYKPGSSGVGASSVANRRAKNRHATVCSGEKCFPCYMTLGQYSNYTHNPNGYVPCAYTECVKVIGGNTVANMDTTTGMNELTFTSKNNGYAYLPFAGMDFFFFGTNYGNSNGTIPTKSIYMNTNSAFGFGQGIAAAFNWSRANPAILFDFFDSYIFNAHVSSEPKNGTVPGSKYVRLVFEGTNFFVNQVPPPTDTTVKKAYEIYYVRDNCYQYMQFNCSVEKCNIAPPEGFDRTYYNSVGGSLVANISNVVNGTAYENTLGAFGYRPPNDGGPQGGGSYVLRSDLNGKNWVFSPNVHLLF